nr:MAG TPA_asm: hypothetical protein [Caudoviricetes sp.]
MTTRHNEKIALFEFVQDDKKFTEWMPCLLNIKQLIIIRLLI